MYSISSEYSNNFHGFRAVVKNEITNKIVYLGGTMWASEELAEGEAAAYAEGYATAGDTLANMYVRKFKKANGK